MRSGAASPCSCWLATAATVLSRLTCMCRARSRLHLWKAVCAGCGVIPGSPQPFISTDSCCFFQHLPRYRCVKSWLPGVRNTARCILIFVVRWLWLQSQTDGVRLVGSWPQLRYDIHRYSSCRSSELSNRFLAGDVWQTASNMQIHTYNKSLFTITGSTTK